MDSYHVNSANEDTKKRSDLRYLGKTDTREVLELQRKAGNRRKNIASKMRSSHDRGYG
ncbi:hypothetical protein OAT16_10400 [Prolixibacteraceae bacterium]|nr:hypothetical protein [Prolixibacteraceae bacterium]